MSRCSIMVLTLLAVTVFVAPQGQPAAAQDQAPALVAPCNPPAIPAQFADQAAVDAFMAKADAYKNCVDAFVAEQEQLMNKHKTAANLAIEEWNEFAAAVNKSQSVNATQ